jgi:hypothetical protein
LDALLYSETTLRRLGALFSSAPAEEVPGLVWTINPLLRLYTMHMVPNELKFASMKTLHVEVSRLSSASAGSHLSSADQSMSILLGQSIGTSTVGFAVVEGVHQVVKSIAGRNATIAGSHLVSASIIQDFEAAEDTSTECSVTVNLPLHYEEPARHTLVCVRAVVNGTDVQ